MHSGSSLSSSGICRSFAKRKPDNQRQTTVRLLGGHSVQLRTCHHHPTVTSVSRMSSVSCPDSIGTVVSEVSKVSGKKRSGARRKRNGNKDSSATDVNANIVLPVCPASDAECVQTNVMSTSVASWSLPLLQSSVGNPTVVIENLPVSSSSHIPDQSEIATEATPAGIMKQTGRRKSNCKARPSTVGRTAVRKSRGRGAVAGPAKNTVVKRRRRSTGTTVNDKFIRSMTTFVSEIAKGMVSACVEQTFTQLSHQGILFSHYATSLPVVNGSVSLLNQHSALNNSNAYQTYSFLQPQVGTLVSPCDLSSTLPSSDCNLATVQQQHASAYNDFFTPQPCIPTENFSNSSDFLGARIEQVEASDASAAGRETPACCVYNASPVCTETVDTTASDAASNSVAQPAQLSNLADFALIDLLNMSDEALDVLLSGSVDCFSDNELHAAACSAANANGVLVSVDAGTYHTDTPVRCSVVTSVTEAFDCHRLLLAAVDSTRMDIPSELYNEKFDTIGEESFLPDYDELDDESDRMSVVTVASSVSATTSAERTIASGKRISIKKPPEKLTVSAEIRRQKRPWKSSSSQNTNNLKMSGVDESSSLHPTASVSSAVSSSSTNAQTSVVRAPSPPCEQMSLIAEEVLEGEG